MRKLRALELTKEDATLSVQKFGLKRYKIWANPELFEEGCLEAEEKDQNSYDTSAAPEKVLFLDMKDRLVFKDEKLTVYPIDIKNAKGKSCFSYLCHPI